MRPIITTIQQRVPTGSAVGDRCFFSGRNGQRVRMTDRTTGTRTHWRTGAFSCITVMCFSSYKLLKTLPVTMLLLFGPVTLLCGLKCKTFLFHLLSEGSVYLSDCEHHQTNTLPDGWWIRGGTKHFHFSHLQLSYRQRGEVLAHDSGLEMTM